MSILWTAFCFSFPPLHALVVCSARRVPISSRRFFADWTCCGACGTAGAAVSAAVGGGWLYVASWGASALLGLILWWLSRRNRKRSLKLLGAKARARLAAMLRNMPRPSPRLVPQTVPV
jgi:hypothetical protein